MAKGGKKGGGDDSGGSSQNLSLVGTGADDRLRGGAGDDTFEGVGGDDQIIGGDGYDTAIYSGSIWNYTWQSSRKGWTVNDSRSWDGDDGRDTLSGIEQLQFNDATYTLGEDAPTVIEVSEIYYVTLGESVDFSMRVWDYDNHVDIDFVGSDLNIGRLSIQGDSSSITGSMGDDLRLNMTFDSSGYFTSDDLSWLAEGETITVTYDFEVSTWKSFETGSNTSAIEQIKFVISGLNDAPTFVSEGPLLLSVVEDGLASSIDLSVFADDVDSDDNANTLIYTILSAPEGFDLSINGSTLIYDPTNIDQAMTSDEFISGEVVLHVLDSHGAVSGLLTVDLFATGADDPRIVYVTSSGVDFAALGIDPSVEPNLGQLSGVFNDISNLDLIAFTQGDDVKIISAERVTWFDSRTKLTDSEGNIIAESAAFDTGAGHDVLVFEIEGGALSGFEISEVSMGGGEDIFSLSVNNIDAVINGANINTGSNSDQVFISLTSDNGWINTNLDTGSGHDIVYVEYVDRDADTLGGAGYVDSNFTLGSGDDFFHLEVAAGDRVLQAGLKVSVNAGTGDDFVFISNEDTSLVFLDGMQTGGTWDDLYHAGITGSVSMGDGDDVLEIGVNDAYVSGSVASLDGGDGYDILTLRHLSANDGHIVTDLGNGLIQLQDGYQTFNISGFEEIVLGDGSDLFLFV